MAFELLQLESEALLRAGRLDAALAALEELRVQARSAEAQAALRERAGLLALEQGEHDMARRLLDEARGTYGARSDSPAQRRIHGHLCTLELARGRWRPALKGFKAIESDARRRQDVDMLAAALAGQGTALRQLGRLRQAVRALAEEERLRRRMGDIGALGRCLVNQALCLFDDDKFDDADDLLERAADCATVVGDRRLRLRIRRRQVELLERVGLAQGQRTLALRRQAEEIAAGLGAPAVQARSSHRRADAPALGP